MNPPALSSPRPAHRPLFTSLCTAGILFSLIVLALLAPQVPDLVRDTANRGFVWMLSSWLQIAYVAAVELLGIIAAIGTLLRIRAFRGFLTAASAGQLVYLAVLLFYLIFSSDADDMPSWVRVFLIAFSCARAVCSALSLWAARSIRADAYYSRPPDNR